MLGSEAKNLKKIYLLQKLNVNFHNLILWTTPQIHDKNKLFAREIDLQQLFKSTNQT